MTSSVGKKKLNKVMRVATNENNSHFIEAGYVENPTHQDEIYFMINGSFVQDCWQIRRDEALVLIMVLSAALNRKVTGLELSNG